MFRWYYSGGKGGGKGSGISLKAAFALVVVGGIVLLVLAMVSQGGSDQTGRYPRPAASGGFGIHPRSSPAGPHTTPTAPGTYLVRFEVIINMPDARTRVTRADANHYIDRTHTPWNVLGDHVLHPGPNQIENSRSDEAREGQLLSFGVSLAGNFGDVTHHTVTCNIWITTRKNGEFLLVSSGPELRIFGCNVQRRVPHDPHPLF